MKKQTRSILQEINTLGVTRNNDLLIETTANNIINSSINLLETIYENYSEEVAYELERRLERVGGGMTYVMNFYANDYSPSPQGRKWSMFVGFQSYGGGWVVTK